MIEQFFATMEPFERTFWYIGIPATLLLTLQMIMTFTGMDGEGLDGDFDSDFEIDTDMEVDGESVAPFQMFTLRNLVAFFTIFCWTGIACVDAGFGKTATILLSSAAGSVTVVALTTLFYFMSKLHQDNTPRKADTVGQPAEVYLTIPKTGEGRGKINVQYGGGYRTLDAISDGPEFKTGAKVKVKAIENGKVLVESV